MDAFTFSQTLYWRDVAVAHVFKKLKLRAVAVAPLHQKGEACGRRCCAVAPKLRHLGDVGVCTIYKAFSYRDVAVATFFNKVELCAVAVAPLHRNYRTAWHAVAVANVLKKVQLRAVAVAPLHQN